MNGAPDPDWYFENVLINAEPGGPVRRVKGPAAAWHAWWRSQLSEHEPVQTAAAQGFVVRTTQLDDLGISRSAARTAVRHGRWSAPARGIVAPISVQDGEANRHLVARRAHALVAAGAAFSHPECVVSGRSAAILDGLPTLEVPARAELTVCEPHRLGPRTGAHAYGAALSTDVTHDWFGVPLTSVARTLVDLGRHDRRDALMAADAALRERLTTTNLIAAALDCAAGWPGVRQARAVLALASPKGESPLESLLRLALHDSGFPPPELQIWIGGFRVDMYWPNLRLIVEADGRGKYTDDELWREKRRDHVLRDFRVEHVIWSDVLAHWAQTLARIEG